MLKWTEIASAIVAKLRDIPGLVAAMGGDPSVISAYRDRWPSQSWLHAALVELKAPYILVVWRRTGPGSFAGHGGRQHEFSIIIRPPEDVPGAADAADISDLIVDGVPAGGGGNKLLDETIHSGCYPMRDPTFERQTLMVSFEASVDYLEGRLVLDEIGNQ